MSNSFHIVIAQPNVSLVNQQTRRRRVYRRPQFQSLHSRQLLAGDGVNPDIDADDLMQLILTARDPTTGAVLANDQNATDIDPFVAQRLDYHTSVGEVFQLEIASQDLREFPHGIFQIATDILVGQPGVLEPALGDVHRLIFDSDSLFSNPSSKRLELFYADAPDQVVSSPLSEFAGARSAERAQFIANQIARLTELVDHPSDLRVGVFPVSSEGVLALQAEIVYINPQLAGVEIPTLMARIVSDDTSIDVVATDFPIRTADGPVHGPTLLRNIEFNSRQADGTRIYGQNFSAGDFAQSATADQFTNVIALGPTAFLPAFFNGRSLFYDPSIAYDSFAIPVRLLTDAAHVDVRLAPASRDANLLYGRQEGEEEVPVDQVALTASSTLSISATFPTQELNLVLPDVVNDILIRMQSDRLLVTNRATDEVLVDRPAATVQSLSVTGGTDNDAVTILAARSTEDFPPMHFVGGGGGDVFNVNAAGFEVAFGADHSLTPDATINEFVGLSATSTFALTADDFDQVRVRYADRMNVLAESTIRVRHQDLSLNADAPIQLDTSVWMDSSIFRASGAVELTAGAIWHANGIVSAAVVSEPGSQIVATGDLRLGLTGQDDGVILNGDLIVGGHQVILRGDGPSQLNGTTRLDGGTLRSAGPVGIGLPGQVLGRGLVATINDPELPLTVDGQIIGDSSQNRLRLNGWVQGTGLLRHVQINGTLSLGGSPAAGAIAGSFTASRGDVDGNGSVTAGDALRIINHLNSTSPSVEALAADGDVMTRFLDVNGDGRVSALDALQIINELNGVDASLSPAMIDEAMRLNDETIESEELAELFSQLF